MNILNLSIVALSIFASSHLGGMDVKSMTQDNPVYSKAETVSLPANVEVKTEVLPAKVEDVVKEYFKDTPILAKVAQCESEFRQVDADGNVLRGVANPFDVGVMQINEKYHLERAQKAGINIYSLTGNMKYALALYKENGTAPWSASQPCWSKL